LSCNLELTKTAQWVVGVAKAGNEEGVPMIGGSQIIAPSGEIVALCVTEEDELITARCDLDQCAPSKSTVSNFGLHREPQAYHLITATKGVISPEEVVAIDQTYLQEQS